MDFGYRDRKRKLQNLEATGSDWRPHPGFFKFVGRFAPKPPGGKPGGPPGGPLGMGHPGKPPGPAGNNQVCIILTYQAIPLTVIATTKPKLDAETDVWYGAYRRPSSSARGIHYHGRIPAIFGFCG